MNLRHAALVSGITFVAAFGQQTQDTSGNSLLQGNYQFRNVAVQAVDGNGNPTEVTATSGLIRFDGAGHYTITGTEVDNAISGGSPQPFSTTGIYAIGSNGTGYVSSPLYSGSSIDVNDYEYGAVSQGVFAGSATEAEDEGYVLNDIFIAMPVGPAPTNASFNSSYQTGLLDFQHGVSTSIMNALFALSPNGAGGFGPITLNGQASNQTPATVTQTISGATYNFNSDGSATLAIPLAASISVANALFTGSKTMFESADGNFILGWSASGYDIFFGVKALTIQGGNAQGLYFTTALEDSPLVSGADSYYGGDRLSGDSVGDAIVHARINFPSYLSYDFGSDDQIVLNATGAAPNPDFSGYLYLFGDGGQAFVGIGTQGNFSLVVGLHAASFSGTGVYLSPIGVASAASYQPITARLAPGELITLSGTGLYSGSGFDVAPQGALPLTLDGVSVTINGIPCPIFNVSATQISVSTPYELPAAGIADIQVTNNTVKSNVVQMYLTDAAPGSFSQNESGIGYAAALHATTGLPITQADPAQPGEFISLFLAGLGTVTPAVPDGAPGPAASPLSIANVDISGVLTVLFNDYTTGAIQNIGTIQFAGLAPGLAGLYQINVKVPTGVLGSGDSVYVEFVTDFADIDQIQIPYGGTATGKTAARLVRPFGQAAHAVVMRSQGRNSSVRTAAGGAPTHVCSTAARLSTTRVCIP